MTDLGVAPCGFVAPGFERVAEAFEQNFSDRAELGAAFAATQDGEQVVDLWGGFAESSEAREWERDTPVLLFSGTKALVAICMLMLVERGELDLHAPVARFWPEFGGRGKSEITVGDVVAHRSRLPVLREPVEQADLADPGKMADLLARQAPETDPRCAFAYHGITYGWLCGELVRRVDGRGVGQFFAEEVAEKLGLDIWIGLPPEQFDRVAVIEYTEEWHSTSERESELIANDELFDALCKNPVLYPPERVIWNSAELLAAEIPAINGVGTPRSVARLFGFLACGGESKGIRLLRQETVELGRTELSRGPDVFGKGSLAFAVGFQLQTSARAFGPPADAYGHTGAGGSALGCWPTERVGFSYAMNRMRPDDPPDPRRAALLSALWECVQG